jgi:quercetin dioxygenase-like cupin family protein
MDKWIGFSLAFLVLIISVTAVGQEQGLIKPQLLLSKIVRGMPKGDKQEMRVLKASFKPGDKTVFHTHRFPVTLYILEGSFTLEKEGSEPETVKAGQATVMPAHVRMTGYNRSSTEPMRVVVFYVSDPDTPFLDPIH